MDSLQVTPISQANVLASDPVALVPSSSELFSGNDWLIPRLPALNLRQTNAVAVLGAQGLERMVLRAPSAMRMAICPQKSSTISVRMSLFMPMVPAQTLVP